MIAKSIMYSEVQDLTFVDFYNKIFTKQI